VMLMPAGFDAALVAKRGARRRKDYRRRMRRLLESGDTEFTLARTLEELTPALEEGFRLNGLRWEGRPDRSLFATEAGRRFHRAVLPHLAAQDLARILLLRVEGRAIAFQYWLAYRGAMVGARRAFDPAFAHVSPGLLTMLQALEEGSAEGLTRVEFLGGPEPYKLEFADGFEPLHEGVGLVRTPAGAVGMRAVLGGIALRRRIRNSERLHGAYLESLAPVRRLFARLRV
jgi:CelD/BcsL family acetyltransferase involved in cellulose biosynthesis